MRKRDFFKKGIMGLGILLIPGKIRGLEYFPRPSDKKIAVLYGTWCGSSRDAAVWISEGMDGIANVFDVHENPDLSVYEHIVIGGSIRSNKVSDLLQEYLEKNRIVIRNKVRGLFTVCGNMRQPVSGEQYKDFIDDHLALLTGAEKVPSRVFLGRITWGLMEPDVREMMQKIPGMEEYDNLKRQECMEFGREILRSVNNS